MFIITTYNVNQLPLPALTGIIMSNLQLFVVWYVHIQNVLFFFKGRILRNIHTNQER